MLDGSAPTSSDYVSISDYLSNTTGYLLIEPCLTRLLSAPETL